MDKPDGITPEINTYINNLVRERLAEQKTSHETALAKAEAKRLAAAEALADLKAKAAAWEADAQALAAHRAAQERAKAFKDAGLNEPSEDDQELVSLLHQRARNALPETEREAFTLPAFLTAETAKSTPHPLIAAYKAAKPGTPGAAAPPPRPAPPPNPRQPPPAPPPIQSAGDRYQQHMAALAKATGNKERIAELQKAYEAEVNAAPQGQPAA